MSAVVVMVVFCVVMKHVCRVERAGGFDYVGFEDVFVLDGVDNWVVVPDVFHPRRKKIEKEDSYDDDWEDFKEKCSSNR